MNRSALIVVLVLVFAWRLGAETISVASWNIENFSKHFSAHRMSRDKAIPDTPLMKQLIAEERRQNDEDNWEVALVIQDAKVNPDILLIQECCAQADLEYFNRRWLNEAYKKVVVFPTNTDREQHLGIMLKEGYEIVATEDQYHKEPDAASPIGKRFARGPAFVLVQSPSGYRFWLGTTHQKSKSGNSKAVTEWRNREAKRTHEIMVNLQKRGPDDVLFVGDLNDDLGLGEFEAEAGGDTVANAVGPAEAGLALLTKPLAEKGEISFGGYWQTRYRSLIDHAIATRSMKEQFREVKLFSDGVAKAASDHYPLVVKFEADPVQRPATLPAANP